MFIEHFSQEYLYIKFYESNVYIRYYYVADYLCLDNYNYIDLHIHIPMDGLFP